MRLFFIFIVEMLIKIVNKEIKILNIVGFGICYSLLIIFRNCSKGNRLFLVCDFGVGRYWGREVVFWFC